jgi:methylase of polypeptide subunit release factors
MAARVDARNGTFEFQGQTYSLSGIPSERRVQSIGELSSEERAKGGLVRQQMMDRVMVVPVGVLSASRESYSFGNVVGQLARTRLSGKPLLERPLTICEVGIGSGVLSLGMELRKKVKEGRVRLIGTDKSPEAVDIALVNAGLNGVPIEIRQTDVLENIGEEFGEVDIVVCSPPWHSPDLADIRQGDFMPREALDGGEKGLEFCRKLAEQTADLTGGEGVLAVRLGPNMLSQVRSIVQEAMHPKDELVIRRSADAGLRSNEAAGYIGGDLTGYKPVDAGIGHRMRTGGRINTLQVARIE